jgi:hypothetical protein
MQIALRRGRRDVIQDQFTVDADFNGSDSLAALRAHAFATDRTLDSTAYDIVNRTLSTIDLAPDTNS